MNCTDRKIGRLITRYELGALDFSEREAFVNHVVSCEFCHNEVYSMAPIMEVLRKDREAAIRGESPIGFHRLNAAVSAQLTRRAWMQRRDLRVAASLFLAVALGALVYIELRHNPAGMLGTGTSQEVGAWSSLAVEKAPFSPSARQPVLRSGGGEEAFRRAMVSYARDEFQSAAEQFEVASRLDPDDPTAQFYWGVSLLLIHRCRDAIDPLRKSTERSVAERREASLYYLVLAYLKSGRASQAREKLVEVIAMGGPHRDAARGLLGSITASSR